MSFIIDISVQADCDIRGLYEYIAYKLLSPDNAVGQLERIESAITGLADSPERHKKFHLEPWASRGLRVMPVDNYLVFYIPDRQTMTVSIVRVLYGGRDVKRILQEEME